MSSTESFDELEHKIKAQVEEALREVREEFLARLESTGNRLHEIVNSEMTATREQAASAASAEAQEAQMAAIAQALEAKEAEFAELLAARDTTIRELEEARSALQHESEEARQALVIEAEEARAAGVAEALEAKEAEFAELLAARDTTIQELEEAKSALQHESEEARAALLEEAEKSRQEAIDAIRAESEEQAAAAVVAALSELRQIVVHIDAARSQSAVLEALLAGSAHYASRSLLFLTREDGLQGWGGQGFELGEGRLQEIHLDYSEGSAWSAIAEGRGTIELDDAACATLCEAIDGSTAAEGVLIPMVLRDRLAAALYAERRESADRYHPLSLQLLAYVAAQALETLPLRQRPATATLRLATEVSADEPGLELWQFLAPVEPEEEPSSETAEQPIPETLEVEDAVPFETLPEPESVAWQEPEETPEPVPATFTTAEETGFEVEPAEEPELAEVVPQPTQVAPPTAAGAEVAPPEDVDGPGWAFTTRRFDGQAGEDATHEEARRLARLLVTEIKLYNEEQVEEGRRGRNIYRALKDDIDRSRQIYEERVDESIRSDTDYFKEELVKILAAGDAEMMGL